MKLGTFNRLVVALGLAIASGAALAQPAGGPGAPPGAGPGPGMMQGDGPGPMRGYGPGCDGGPGKARGYGGGAQWGGGPGAMHGWGGAPQWGGGPGMMRGRGGGPGWGGGYGPGRVFAELDLTPDQQEKIAKVHEDMRRSIWDTMGQLHAEQFKLRGLYLADKPDPNAISDQQKKVDELHRAMIKSRVETGNRIEALLTKEQRERLREYAPWWMEDGDD